MTKEKNTRPARRQQLAVLGRVLGYMVRHYKFSCLAVVVCILGSALATLAGTLFMQSLIDDYILPLTQAAQPDFGPLAAALGRLAAVYVLGILCAYGLQPHHGQRQPGDHAQPPAGALPAHGVPPLAVL